MPFASAATSQPASISAASGHIMSSISNQFGIRRQVALGDLDENAMTLTTLSIRINLGMYGAALVLFIEE